MRTLLLACADCTQKHESGAPPPRLPAGRRPLAGAGAAARSVNVNGAGVNLNGAGVDERPPPPNATAAERNSASREAEEDRLAVETTR